MGFRQKIFLMQKIGLDMVNRSDDNLLFFFSMRLSLIMESWLDY